VVGGGIQPGLGDCTTVARVNNGRGIENEEQGAPIRVCRSVPAGWDAAWPSSATSAEGDRSGRHPPWPLTVCTGSIGVRSSEVSACEASPG
jgi:hypothetical protein